MRSNINRFINHLSNNKTIKAETINLLSQSKDTLKNVHKLIKNKSIVDANALLRLCFENIIMGMMINFDENVYKEFIDLSITDANRKYTKPQYLRNHFKKILKELDDDLFGDVSKRKLGEILDELYNKLCLSTHSTLIVSAIVELKNEENVDINILALKIDSYFLELVLYLCLKYLNNSQTKTFDNKYIIIGMFVLFADIKIENFNVKNTETLKTKLHYNVNKESLDKNKDDIESLIVYFNQLISELQLNPTIITKILVEAIM